MRTIVYREGDATQPLIARGRCAVIAHAVNHLGGWCNSCVLTGDISRRWPAVEREHRAWHRGQIDWEMGAVQFVPVDPRIVVATMLCLYGNKNDANLCPLRYPALVIAWQEVVEYALEQKADIHIPKLGAWRAGSDWSKICEILERDTPDDVGLFCYRSTSKLQTQNAKHK